MLTDKHWGTIVAAMCMAVLAMVAFAATFSGMQSGPSAQSSTSNAPKKCEHAASDCHPNNENDSAFFVALGNFIHVESNTITAVSTVLLAIITAGLVFVVYVQIITARAQLRAYLLVDQTSVFNVTGDSSPYVEIVFKNTGLTPAYKVRTYLAPLIFTEFENANVLPIIPRSNLVSEETIGPQQIRKSRFDDMTNMVDIAMVMQLHAGTHAIFAYGVTDYIDAFGKPRITEFRFFTGGPIGLHRGNALSAHHEGNSST
jgi:hypothetical protein